MFYGRLEMSVFAKAAAKKAEIKKSSKPAKKETVWSVGDPDGDKVAKSVHELAELRRRSTSSTPIPACSPKRR
jgi:hypothetical protein